jgi:hypothetical protein
MTAMRATLDHRGHDTPSLNGGQRSDSTPQMGRTWSGAQSRYSLTYVLEHDDPVAAGATAERSDPTPAREPRARETAGLASRRHRSASLERERQPSAAPRPARWLPPPGGRDEARRPVKPAAPQARKDGTRTLHRWLHTPYDSRTAHESGCSLVTSRAASHSTWRARLAISVRG